MHLVPRSVPHPIAVIGVGNEFRRDDGVGPAVVSHIGHRAVGEPLPAGTALWTCDGEPARLISLWERAGAVIVVDAARTDASVPSGRIQRFACTDTLIRQASGATSSHGLGLAAAVELALAVGRLPASLIVYTVEIGDLGNGVGLSAQVGAAVEPAARRIEDEVARLARAMG